MDRNMSSILHPKKIDVFLSKYGEFETQKHAGFFMKRRKYNIWMMTWCQILLKLILSQAPVKVLIQRVD